MGSPGCDPGHSRIVDFWTGNEYLQRPRWPWNLNHRRIGRDELGLVYAFCREHFGDLDQEVHLSEVVQKVSELFSMVGHM
jgi:hypothetical protein